MRKLSRIVNAKFRIILKDYKITENQLTIMFFMYAKKNIEQGNIGKALRLERSTVSRGVDILIKRGFLKKDKAYHPVVSITGDGAKIVDELKPKWEKIMDEILDTVGEDGFNAVSLLEEKLL